MANGWARVSVGMLALAGFANWVSASETYFVDATLRGDIADASAWDGTPGKTASDKNWVTNHVGTLTALTDVEFGLFKVNNSTSAGKSVVFDLTEAASGGKPRCVKVKGFNVGKKNQTVELRGGVWDFAGAGDGSGKSPSFLNSNGFQSGDNHLILTSGAVVTNITTGYAWFVGDQDSDITLRGKSRLHAGNAWLIDGKRCSVRVEDGSQLLMGALSFGRGSLPYSNMASNSIVVAGRGSYMRCNSWSQTGTAIGPVGNFAGPGANALIVTNYGAFCVMGTGGPGPFTVGCTNSCNRIYIADYGSVTGATVCVGLYAPACSNSIFVGSHGSLNIPSAGTDLVIGNTAGADYNEVVVSNGSLNVRTVRLGNGGSSHNRLRVIGRDSFVQRPAGNLFGRGCDNVFEMDDASLDWSVQSVMVGGQYGAATNNAIRLTNGSSLSVYFLYVGNSANDVGNVLEIAGSSTLTSSWSVYVHDGNVLRLKVPKTGCAKPFITHIPGSSQTPGAIVLAAGSTLDIEIEDGYADEGWKTLLSSGANVDVPANVLAAAQARIGDKYLLRLSADRKSLCLKKKAGLMLLVR